MASVRITISYPDNPNVSGVRIYRSSNKKASWKDLGIVTGREYVDKDLPVKTEFWYALATVMKDSREAHYWECPSASITCYETVSYPDNVSGFTGVQNGAYVNLSWTANTDTDLSHYEIRRGSSGWGGSQLLTDNATGTSFQYTWSVASSQTFMIKAVDTTGNYSAGYAEISVNIKALENYLVDASTSFTSTYGGTLTNVEVNATDLQLSAIPSIVDLTDYIVGYDFPVGNTFYHTGNWVSSAIDFTSSQSVRLEVDATASVDGEAYGYIYNTRAPIGGYQNGDHYQDGISTESMCGAVPIAGGESWRRITQMIDISTAASSTPTWQGFRYYTPGDFYARHIRYKVTFESRWGIDRPRIKAYTVRKLLKNKKIEGGGITVPTIGWPIFFSTYAPEYEFVNSPIVIASIENSRSYIGYTVHVSAVSPAGVEFYVNDASGDPVGGNTVKFIAVGT